MSQLHWILTGPGNQHLLCKPRAVSNLEVYGNIQNVLNILIVQIPGLGRTLHLTKDMNDQMVEFGFQGKGES